MYIRSVRLVDLPLFGRLRRRTLRLGQPAAQVGRYAPLPAALAGVLPLAGVRTYVMGEERPLAFVQVAAPPRAHRWEVLYLGRGGDEEPDEALEHPWLLLLNYAALAAGRRRVTRLLAKVPAAAAEQDCFRQAGFQVYGHEAIYTRTYTEADRLAEAGPPARPQRPSDDWLIHRLYFQTAPRPVQDAEAATSSSWALQPRRAAGGRQRGWLVEDAAETIAYIRTLSGRSAHMLEWLYEPAHRADLPRLVRQSLAQLPAAPGDRLFWCVREHQSEAEALLSEAGFVLAGTQALMVRFLAVKAPVRERLFAPVHAARRQRLVVAEAGRR